MTDAPSAGGRADDSVTPARRPDVAAIVMAAGLGKRFRSAQAKVMHRVAGRTMLGHVLEALRPVGVGQIVVVVGHQADDVTREAEAADLPGLTTVLQSEQRGTGHAVESAYPALRDDVRRIVVLPGDSPLITGATIERLLDADPAAPAVIATAEVDDPTGYGRVLRDGGAVTAIVEEADASAEQKAFKEINAGAYVFHRDQLADMLAGLTDSNAQGERYLTDAVELFVRGGQAVRGVVVDEIDLLGVNDRVQLARAGGYLRSRILERLMRDGVTVVDPAATYVEATVSIGRDSVVLPGCVLEGTTSVGEGSTIGPYTRLVDARVGDGATVAQSTVLGADVGDEVSVGPYTYLRPGARLERASKAGAFVEIKKSTVGEGSKVPHLSYVGDATIGRDVNVGAGTITCNFDGFDKHETVIEDEAFVGSGTMLVAPIRVGRGAVTGAGSAITEDVPDGALSLERTEQRDIEGWADRRRQRKEPGDEPGVTGAR